MRVHMIDFALNALITRSLIGESLVALRRASLIAHGRVLICLFCAFGTPKPPLLSAILLSLAFDLVCSGSILRMTSNERVMPFYRKSIKTNIS